LSSAEHPHAVLSPVGSRRSCWRSKRVATAAVLAVLLSAALIVVGVHRTRSSAQTTKLAVQVVGDPRQIVLPLDRYQPTLAQNADVTRAVALLGTRCMRRFGLGPVIDPAQVVSADVVDIGEQRRYGPLDANQAARYGFHPPPALITRQLARLHASGIQLAVWTGRGPKTAARQPIPTGGCQAQAQQQLAAGGRATDPTLPMRLADQSWHESQENPEVRAAFAAWSRCMAASGFDYAVPMDAVNDPRSTGPSPTKFEIRVARADVACMHRVNVAGIWLAAETALQQRAVTQHSEQLTAIAAANTAMVRAAQTIDNGHPR
jgi:hypothetical protein